MRLGEANALNEEIKNVEKLIKDAEAYEEAHKPKLIFNIGKDKLDQMGIVPLMIECHLIADFLTEILYMIVDICKAYGYTDIKFLDELNYIIKNSEKFAGSLIKIYPDLEDMLVRNETFNASLHKKYLKYMEQRMISKDNSKKDKKASNNQ